MKDPVGKPQDYTPNSPALKGINFVVPMQFAGLRLDQALAKLAPDYSRSRLQSWIRDEKVWLDGAACNIRQKVWGGESVVIEAEPDPLETAYAPQEIALNVLYEDAFLIVIDKPAGLVVHPGSGNWEGTLLNALLHHAPELSAIPRAGIVHRLDKETSGLLVVAKTLPSQTSLVRQLQGRSVKRQYLALVHGIVARGGTIDAPIGRHPTHRTKMAVVGSGKPARTHYRVLESHCGCTLLECTLESGRTHQIRVHMQYIGHPIVGDPVYGNKPKQSENSVLLAAFPRQALHAKRLSFAHPESGEFLEFESDLPEDLAALLEKLE
ncbi:MAG: 23S rRNA pseudouridine(1911/1915/1917) synthase RluD [Burkholderiales bacterium]|nr:23S rRNA pseudouridine(1911/1915/1917) synthase RluD [Burkholderiales bacterium]